MKNRLLVAWALFILGAGWGCSTSSVTSRQPASSDELDTSLQSLEDVFYQGQIELDAFDRDLDDAIRRGRHVSPLTLGNYPRLLALRQIRDTLLENLGEWRKRASRADITHLQNVFDQAVGSDRLALSSAALELDVSPNDPGIIDTSLIQTMMDEKKREISERGALLRDQVQEKAAFFQESLKGLSRQGRVPQSTAKFHPDPGKAGNLFGTEYPKGTWSFTFDDGPLPKYTSQVLANLQKHGLKATFFELAQNVSEYPDSSRGLQAAGMNMADHSWDHPDLTKLDAAGLQHQIVDSRKKITEILGVAPKLFRCPYGAGVSVPRVRQKIASEGMIHVYWTVDTLDWQDKDPNSILARAKKEMQLSGGGIILFHDIHPQSVTASNLLMDDFAKRIKGGEKLRVQDVQDVIDEMNGE